MNRRFTKMLSVALAVIMLTAIMPISAFAETKTYALGDIVELGSYPQTEVTDEALIEALNAVPGEWQSYGYYEAGVQSDFMQFKDVTYAGEKYRAVTFSIYRPNFSSSVSGEHTTSQDENGYFIGEVYWFKFEPLKWQILDPETGLALCTQVIDGQPFQNHIIEIIPYFDAPDDSAYITYWYTDETHEHYGDNYELTYLREWLNDTFFMTGFSESEQEKIKTTTVTNPMVNDPAYDETLYGGTTYDKVFILSYDDMINPAYGFNPDPYDYSDNRTVIPTDYSLCQGVMSSPFTVTAGNCYFWYIRSNKAECRMLAAVDDGGQVQYFGAYYEMNSVGTRPAITIDLSKLDEEPEPEILLGDINGDGEVSSKDSRLLKQYIAGTVKEEDIVYRNADVNQDGEYGDSKDSRALKKLIVS